MSIFTPHNEPYLGVPLLVELDKLIVWSLDENQKLAVKSRQRGKSDIQEICCVLVPQIISLSLGIRELIRQGYLFSALIQRRPLMERTITLLYLNVTPAKRSIWFAGWSYGDRPKLREMLEQLLDEKWEELRDDIRHLANSMNSLIHGDPESAAWNLISVKDKEGRAPVGKILNRRDLCEICASEAITSLVVAISTATDAFGNKISKE